MVPGNDALKQQVFFFFLVSKAEVIGFSYSLEACNISFGKDVLFAVALLTSLPHVHAFLFV
jgi:hypothetical protein